MAQSLALPATNLRKLVRLNVGGYLYTTTMDTIMRHGTHMLSTLLSGSIASHTSEDDDGWVFIDRDGSQFSHILNYLREGEAFLLPDTRSQQQALLQEAKFYLLDGLADLIKARLVVSPSSISKCITPLIINEEEDLQYIVSTRNGMPLVKFVYSRCNNKFSYTTVSDDALLRNIELFDKLSLKFSGRIVYAKDTTGKSGHICTWFFYGHGRLLAELCCSSMVYQAEKKLTKIEFPEARLYEENMNMLLFEKPPVEGDETHTVACQDIFARRQSHFRAASPQ